MLAIIQAPAQPGVHAAGIQVGSAEEAHRVSTGNGAVSILKPTALKDLASGKSCCIAEVAAYGDVVLRFVSGSFGGPLLPNYAATEAEEHCFGLQRMDHCVGNVPQLFEATDYLSRITGAQQAKSLLRKLSCSCCMSAVAVPLLPYAAHSTADTAVLHPRIHVCGLLRDFSAANGHLVLCSPLRC